MGYSKDFAINLANERANKLGFKHYVIHNPKGYREIFNNTGFVVEQTVKENEKTSVVYETE
ncbi:hypothetical protein [Bacillus amyloliquefaciens]|uniref:hypothetical protein n=1 Tax=Bacillus amyloliquefaciens TaxID=1390 RepID=UPI001CA3D615|nr:hypothetical protein [Bacillus amyloliquefaciens]QZY34541.1 hypothetical protein BAJP3144_09200 [Bacillus amyloliquefaciens]